MSTPPLLVVMPVYNVHRYLKQAVESILNQTYQDFQFLIVNDGSTDGSGELARSFKDPRIMVWDQDNRGPGESMNRALEYACSLNIPYLARFDADDIAFPDRLEKQLNLLNKHPDAGAISANCYYIHVDTEEIIGTSTVSSFPWMIKWEIFHGLRGLIQPVCMFRTHSLAEIGGYRPQFPQAEETDVFLRLAEHYQLINHVDYLCMIRIRPNSLSIGNVSRNIQYQFYAMDCSIHRRQGRPERDIESFLQAPGIGMRYRIWREENVLKLWREGMTHQSMSYRIAAALIDPRRAFVRALRKINLTA